MKMIETIRFEEVGIYSEILYVGGGDPYTECYKTTFNSFSDSIGVNDPIFRIYTNLGEEYVAVFKAFPMDMPPAAYLIFEEEGWLIVQAGIRIYRFLTNEKACLSVTDYEIPSHCKALASPERKILVVTTVEGLISLTWEKELWKREFHWSHAGYLELIDLKDDLIIAEYYTPGDIPNSHLLTINIITGEIVSDVEHKGRWYHIYKDLRDGV